MSILADFLLIICQVKCDKMRPSSQTQLYLSILVTMTFVSFLSLLHLFTHEFVFISFFRVSLFLLQFFDFQKNTAEIERTVNSVVFTLRAIIVTVEMKTLNFGYAR